MATINNNGLLINNSRVFLRSETINVFPCSRRGQEHLITDSFNYYDPEARLNTERTNRLHTAVNGFKDSFIDNYVNKTLIFVLAGYRAEAKNFDPVDIASALGSDTTTLYAHLFLHTDVSLGVKGYFTEMLLRQSDSADDKNYLDVSYEDGTNSGDFFVGISFTKELIDNNDPTVTVHNLPLFSYVDDEWELVQTSLLPKVEHDTEPDSIKLGGDFTVVHPVLNEDGTPVLDTDGKPETQVSFKVTKDETLLGPTVMSSLIVGEMTEGEGFSDGTIKAKEHIEAPTLSVDTVSSRQENGTITIESPIALDGTATLNNGLEVTAGDATIKSNLKVEDNINVGTPATPATADNGGYIVAKKDITAEQDLIAKRDIKATEKATVKSLVVGERADTDSTAAGTLIAKKEVNTPQLRVDRITSSQGNITIDNKKLIVNKSLEMLAPQPTTEKPNPEPAEATIEKAVIGDLTVEKKNTLKGSTGKITAKEMWLKDIGQVPAVELAHLTTTDTYQVRFKFGTPITIIEE